MPYRTEWEEPEVMLEHNGVTVYHAYKDDEATQMLWYWFTLIEDKTSDFDDETFDVRDLPNWTPDPSRKPDLLVDSLEHIRAKLREAIDLGHLKAPEEPPITDEERSDGPRRN